MFRTTLIALALVAGTAATAEAQTCDAEPQFAAHRTANSNVRAQFSAVERGEWRQALHFGREATTSGTSSGNKAAAFTNLCIVYAQTGETADAIGACDAAIELRPNAWRAYNNRGAAHWLAGDYAAASADFSRASALGGGEDEVIANSSLSQCATDG